MDKQDGHWLTKVLFLVSVLGFNIEDLLSWKRFESEKRRFGLYEVVVQSEAAVTTNGETMSFQTSVDDC